MKLKEVMEVARDTLAYWAVIACIVGGSDLVIETLMEKYNALEEAPRYHVVPTSGREQLSPELQKCHLPYGTTEVRWNALLG